MTITTELRGKKYIFETKPGLFSKEQVDAGTRLLIDTMLISKSDIVLDLGCGYGPIGIVAANLAKEGKVYMVDVDIRAVKYSLINAELNKVKNVVVKTGDGFESLEGIKIDVVLSNPPSHTPKETIREFLKGAKKQLKPNGKLYFVVERRIKPMYEREIEAVFGNYEEVASSAKHVVLFAVNKK